MKSNRNTKSIFFVCYVTTLEAKGDKFLNKISSVDFKLDSRCTTIRKYFKDFFGVHFIAWTSYEAFVQIRRGLSGFNILRDVYSVANDNATATSVTSQVFTNQKLQLGIRFSAIVFVTTHILHSLEFSAFIFKIQIAVQSS